MKLKVLFLAGISLLWASVAQAQDVEFEGNGFLEARSQACLDAGFSKFNFASFRFHPASVGSNPDEGRLSIFFNTFAVNHVVDGGFANSLKVYKAVGLTDQMFRFRGRMKKRRQAPSSISPSTDFVTLLGVIQKFSKIRGCTMVFEANMRSR